MPAGHWGHGCCVSPTGNNYHEGCSYAKKPVTYCQHLCDHDINCKGFVENTWPGYEGCKTATTSACLKGGFKFSQGSQGDLVRGDCGKNHEFLEGCYVKQIRGM